MTRILGLDLSLSSTGIALPDGTTTTIRPRHVDPRGRRLNDLAGQLWPTIEPTHPQLAIIEGYSYGSARLSPMGYAHRAELVGIVHLFLRRDRVPIVEVSPSTLKAYATGYGNADKPTMVAAARAAGANPANDDEADAYLLRAFGLLIVDGHDLFNQPTDVTRREHLARDLWWPTHEELTHA